MVENTLGQVAYEAWFSRVTDSDFKIKNVWQAVANAVVAAHEARRWKPIESAPKDGGKTWILGRGKYAHPFDPAFNEVVVAQIYFSRLYQEWLDTQCARFIPVEWIPAPPKEADHGA